MKKTLTKTTQKIMRWFLITLPHRFKNLRLKTYFVKIRQQFVKIRPKHKLIALGVILAIILLVAGIKYHQYNTQNPYAVWEAMVVLRSQESGSSPEEDAKTSLKRGDVIAVQAPGHAWSETEYKSYLLVKIEGRKQDVEKLLQPLTRTPSVSPSETSPPLKGGGGSNVETIRARKYSVDMDKVGFSGDQVISGQPVEGKVFKIDVIKEK